MTHTEARLFLLDNQPLPPDDKISQDQLNSFDQVRLFLADNPDESFIPLMLNAFGDGSGYGLYQVCDNVFRCFSTPKMAPHLEAAMRSPHKGVRYWATHWAPEFPDESLIPVLSERTRDKEADTDFFAIFALSVIFQRTGNRKALEILKRRREGETDQELLEVIDETIAEAEPSSARDSKPCGF
jgi:hypothetical protein